MAKRRGMKPALPPEIVAATRRFQADGVRADLLSVRPLVPGLALAPLFAADLVARGWGVLPEPPRSDWFEVSVAEGVTVLASCRYHRLAYGTTRGAAAGHLDAARALAEAIGARRVWSNSTASRIIDPDSLALLRGAHRCSNMVTEATFEETLVLAGDAFAALVVWTDED